MYDIDAQQIKAARALLDWTREDLAQRSGVSIGTISGVEAGFTPKDTTLLKICETINNAGVDITEDGVRRRPDEVRVFRGKNGCDKFFSNVEKVSAGYNGDVLALIVDEELWQQSNGQMDENNLTRLAKLRGVTGVKCLLTETVKPHSQMSAIQFQYLPQAAIVPLPSCAMIYGNRYAIIVTVSKGNFVIAEFNIPAVALSYRKDFLSLWDKASSLKTKPGQSKRTNRS